MPVLSHSSRLSQLRAGESCQLRRGGSAELVFGRSERAQGWSSGGGRRWVAPKTVLLLAPFLMRCRPFRAQAQTEQS